MFAELEVVAEGITLGFTLEIGGRASEICGTLKPSNRVDLVLRLTLVVTTGAFSFERRVRAAEVVGASDRTCARPKSEEISRLELETKGGPSKAAAVGAKLDAVSEDAASDSLESVSKCSASMITVLLVGIRSISVLSTESRERTPGCVEG